MRSLLKKKQSQTKTAAESSFIPTTNKKSPAASRPQISPIKNEQSIVLANDDSGVAGASQQSHTNMQRRALSRMNIFSKPVPVQENFITPCYPKSAEAMAFIDAILRENFVFTSLSQKERRTLIDAMKSETVPDQARIINQGETGDYFYVLESGTVNFLVNGNHVGSCSRGGSFGELALLYDSPRAASCIAAGECVLWKVDQNTFRHILANSTNSQKENVHHILKKVPFLAELDVLDLSKLSDVFKTVHFSEGDRIINKGDEGESFYILEEGTAKVHDIGFGDSQYIEQPLEAGDFFGERALLTGDPRAANITATSACTCLSLSRETFQQVLGPLQGAIDRAMNKRTLLGVPMFAKSKFQNFEITRLADLIEEKTFPKDTILAEQGKPLVQALYVIRSGKVSLVHEDGMIETLKDADHFGSQTLKEPNGSLSTQTIKVREETICGVLRKSDIEEVIGNIARLGEPFLPTSAKLNRLIRFKDLTKIKILGDGTFGQVWLVSHKTTGKSYALKQLNKREIIGHHQIEGVLREKNIMASLDHPFVIDLISTYQDELELYMLIDLVQGGELFSVIHSYKRDGMPNGNARFYAACILEALSHFHTRSIAYRDLKPENVLIDQGGYCIVIDLGFAKVVDDKTYTLCGTPEYLAPEVIVSKGHDKGVDYWAYGALIYEMIVGYSPFYLKGTDQVSLFKRIIQAQFDFPDDVVVHEHAQDLIKKLLVQRQAERFGCRAAGETDIRNHKWFEVIDFEKLLRKEFPTPWKPKIKSALDASHFENYRELENEIPARTRPLTTAEQKYFRDF